MKKDLIIFLMFIFAFSCCKNKNLSHINAISFNEEKNDISLDSLKSLKLVHLENTDECILSSVDQIFYTDSCFIIFDSDNEIIVKYALDGKFIGFFSNQGQGPKEYTSLSSIDVYKNKLCFSDYESKSLIFNTSTLDFVESIDYLGNHIAFINNNSFAVHNELVNNGIDKHLSIYDNNLNLVYDTMKISFASGYLFEPINKFFRLQDTLFYFPYFDDTIYQIYNNKCIPFISIDFGKYSLPDKDLLNSFINNDESFKNFMKTDEIYIHGYEPVFNNNFLAIRYWTKGNKFMGFYNLNSKQTFYFNTSNLQDKNFMYWIKGSYDNNFLSPVLVSDLKESPFYKDNIYIQSFLNNNTNLDDEDIVIIIWEL